MHMLTDIAHKVNKRADFGYPAFMTHRSTHRRTRDEIRAEFGKWLSKQAESRGWTQVELAERLEVSQTAVSYWLRGVRVPDQNDRLDRIASVFGVSREFVYRLAGLHRARPRFAVYPASIRKILH